MLVIKRDGKKEQFAYEKIGVALSKVYKEIGLPFSLEECLEQAKELEISYSGIDEIDIEAIQDDVELFLMQKNHFHAAKAYIKYREMKKQLRENPWTDNDDRQDLILSKYLRQNETKKAFLKRIAIGNTRLEKIFRNKEAIWGGRNLYAIGREGNITGSNCYVTEDPEDNLESIYKADYNIAKTYAYGGGQGMNISKLRPKGAKVNNTSSTTPGPMVFAEKYSHTTLNTQQENRRGALMLVMNVEHPDFIDFCTAKLDLNKINGANISLAISDKFMQAVENEEHWTMEFATNHEVIRKTASAYDLLNVLGYTAHTMGDPGVLFIDNVNNYHFLTEYEDVHYTATNPCGEQPLAAHGSCNLGSINLNAFVRNPYTANAHYDWERFDYVTKEMIYGLDDLLTMLGDRHPLKEQREHVKDWREIGLGVMGLADVALSMRKPYGSDEFLAFLDELMHRMINSALQASALRAAELGSFPRYDYNKISNSTFYKAVITPETDELVRKYGMRNSRLLSIAPTGSISNVLGVSGGVEPFFMLNYTRKIISIGDTPQYITVWEKAPKALAAAMGIDADQLPEWARITSQNIPFERRAMVQATIQKYVDTAISSTFNIPNSATVQDVMNIYRTAWKMKLKGATVFRDNCAKVGILSAQYGQEVKDLNPGVAPIVPIREEWYDMDLDEVKVYEKEIKIGVKNEIVVKTTLDVCPLCGSVLVKKDGCTKCSNNECVYEKCAM